MTIPAESRWLDMGCGTGALSQTIINQATPREVVGIDASAGYVAYAHDHVNDERISFVVGDVQALCFADASFDVAVSGLVLNFVPNSEKMIHEMRRVVRPGGVVALYVWDYAGEMQLMRHFWNAAVALDSAAQRLDEGVRFPLCQPEALSQLCRVTGLREVAVRAIDVPTVFRDFDDYWLPFLGGQAPAPSYAMSLTKAQRDTLRERIRAELPFNPDGAIYLIARAWAVRGNV